MGRWEHATSIVTSTLSSGSTRQLGLSDCISSRILTISPFSNEPTNGVIIHYLVDTYQCPWTERYCKQGWPSLHISLQWTESKCFIFWKTMDSILQTEYAFWCNVSSHPPSRIGISAPWWILVNISRWFKIRVTFSVTPSNMSRGVGPTTALLPATARIACFLSPTWVVAQFHNCCHEMFTAHKVQAKNWIFTVGNLSVSCYLP